MNRIILFSPIGGTDPMPQTNFRDGSMIHVCRVYQPTDVYLYMSAEMLDLQEKDDRYRYCLLELARQQGREVHCEIIKRQELKDVQLFDYFYEDFRVILRDIAAEMDETDTLILNISSGTPAMKSGLLVLATLGEYPYKIVQVATPMGRMNTHRHDGEYDVKSLWELNEDNEDDFTNRCMEVTCPNLLLLKQEILLKTLIEVYDYDAAWNICRTLPSETTKAYAPFLQMAVHRLHLNLDKVNFLEKKVHSGCVPIKDDFKQKYFEYALNLEIKRRKQEYVDFVRALTPLIVDLFSLVLAHELNLNLQDLCIENKRKWDPRKMMGTEWGRILTESYADFRYGPVYSDHLYRIMKVKLQQKSKLLALAEGLRGVEKDVRNIAAHEIVSLSDEEIKKRTKHTSEEIMEMIKKIFHYTNIHVSEKDWSSYDAMNQKIRQAMES